jgi:hypothetical protein
LPLGLRSLPPRYPPFSTGSLSGVLPGMSKTGLCCSGNSVRVRR